MSKNYLILTPIKITWPKKFNNNLLFASESAILNYRGTQNKFKNVYINPFKWKDKNILREDFKKLNSIFEKFLIFFSNELNRIHNCNYSYRTWRIVLGPWLSNFIHIFYERFSNIEILFKKKKVDKCIFINFFENLVVPYDPREFRDLIQNDYWNQNLYQKILLKYLNKKNIIEKQIPKNKQIEIFNNASQFFKNSKKKLSFLKYIFNSVLNFINRRNNKYFIFGNNLGLINEIKLALKFHQLPLLDYKENRNIKKSINQNLRDNLKKKFKVKNKFEKICFEASCDLMPTLFLENFIDFNIFKNQVNLPSRPKVILMSYPLWYQTKLLFFVANLIEKKKSVFLYGQHGGTYGLAKVNWHEKFEISVADKYLTWGWNIKDNKKITKFFIFKNLKKKKNKKKYLTVIMRGRLKRYFSSLESSTGTEVYSDYITNVSNFLFNIKDSLKKNIILRLPQESSKDFDFYGKLTKKFKFDNSHSFSDACNESKLTIHTSNATTFLETLSSNIPTILVINKKTNPFKKESKILINSLEKNNIIFFSPLSAAKFINKICDNKINSWWNHRNTQKAVKKFSDKYANKTNNIVKELKNILENV